MRPSIQILQLKGSQFFTVCESLFVIRYSAGTKVLFLLTCCANQPAMHYPASALQEPAALAGEGTQPPKPRPSSSPRQRSANLKPGCALSSHLPSPRQPGRAAIIMLLVAFLTGRAPETVGPTLRAQSHCVVHWGVTARNIDFARSTCVDVIKCERSFRSGLAERSPSLTARENQTYASE